MNIKERKLCRHCGSEFIPEEIGCKYFCKKICCNLSFYITNDAKLNPPECKECGVDINE